ncbi:MAG: NUDIX domain-containing protein [Eubacteriales bacterium]|nr:NUDIX domain-containing protein [Eubacteriales bacterium]
MKYCYDCGTKLIEKYLEGEGMIPYCENCQQYRFPIFNTAVSMEVLNPAQDKVILIQQYGRKQNILVAGYVNRGESAEQAVIREVKEELGLDVGQLRFNKSQFFAGSNTLMINFSCVATSEDLSGKTDEVDFVRWYTFEEAREHVLHHSLAEKFLLHCLDRVPHQEKI